MRTGLRRGELLGLRWEDLDLDGGTASIHRSFQRTPTGGLTILHTKTRASGRRIALPTECINSLKAHRECLVIQRPRLHHPHRRPYRPRQPHPPLRPARQPGRAPRDPLPRPPTHSTAALLLEQGVDLVVIKELLGHAHIGVTAGVYAHVRLRLQRQAVDTLGGVLGSTADDPDDPSTTAVVR